MRQSFPSIESFAVKGPWKSIPTKSENLIFFAGAPLAQHGTSDFVGKVAPLVEQRRLPFEAITLLNTHRTEPWEPGLVLTDDYAPYDLLIGSSIQEAHPLTGDK